MEIKVTIDYKQDEESHTEEYILSPFVTKQVMTKNKPFLLRVHPEFNEGDCGFLASIPYEAHGKHLSKDEVFAKMSKPVRKLRQF